MAQIWEAKTPTETKRYRWTVPVQDCDGLLTFSASVTGATIDDSGIDGNDVVLYVSGGTAANTAAFTLSALTNEGESLTETVYLPILPVGNSSAFAATAQDIITFALKPIAGLGDTATTDETDDALEWLNGMLASWKGQGADVGAALSLTTGSVIYAPDEWLLAIKNNLRVLVAEQYGRQVSPVTGMLARQGLGQIKQSNLPTDRSPAEYF